MTVKKPIIMIKLYLFTTDKYIEVLYTYTRWRMEAGIVLDVETTPIGRIYGKKYIYHMIQISTKYVCCHI